MRIPAAVDFVPATLLLCSFFPPAVEITVGLDSLRMNGFQAFTVLATDGVLFPRPFNVFVHLWLSFCCILVLLLPLSRSRSTRLLRTLGALLIATFFASLLWSLHLRALPGSYIFNLSFALAGALAILRGQTKRYSGPE